MAYEGMAKKYTSIVGPLVSQHARTLLVPRFTVSVLPFSEESFNEQRKLKWVVSTRGTKKWEKIEKRSVVTSGE